MLGSNMSIDNILRLPDEAFLYAAYRHLLGRSPDPEGLGRYRKLLKQFGKLLVLAELRASPEGHKKAYLFISKELDRLVRRYKMLRSLPFGNFRWRLLNSMHIKPALKSKARPTDGSNQSKQTEAIDARLVAYQRDIYWITKIAAQRARLSDNDITAAALDADALIRHLYRTRNTTNE